MNKNKMLYINSNDFRNKIFKTFSLEPFPVSLKREMKIEKILFIHYVLNYNQLNYLSSYTFSKSLDLLLISF